MNITIAIIIGVSLLVIVDIIGAYASRKFKFNYGYLAIISLLAIISPLIIKNENANSFDNALYSLIIYAPETLFGALFAYKIDACCGKIETYRSFVTKTGWKSIYLGCFAMWFVMTLIIYCLSNSF